MTKISPIAAYLCANKARAIKNGNITRFVSPEGMYLGHQIKSEQDGATAYSIEILYGLKKMFFQTTVLGQKLAYVADSKAELGVSLVPTQTHVFKCIMDFFNNSMRLKQTTRTLMNELEPIAVDEETGVGLFNTYRPFLYKELVNEDKTAPFDKNIIKYHFDKN